MSNTERGTVGIATSLCHVMLCYVLPEFTPSEHLSVVTHTLSQRRWKTEGGHPLYQLSISMLIDCLHRLDHDAYSSCGCIWIFPACIDYRYSTTMVQMMSYWCGTWLSLTAKIQFWSLCFVKRTSWHATFNLSDIKPCAYANCFRLKCT